MAATDFDKDGSHFDSTRRSALPRLSMEEDVKRNSEAKHRRPTPLQPTQEYPPDWVPIQVPSNLEEMFQNWAECDEPNVGWCLMCNGPIRSVDDLIPGTNFHNCESGRAFEEQTRAEP